MATKVYMEALSPTMEEGRLVKWVKSEGDKVASGDPIAEVETDKAIMELVARGDGVLRKQLIGEGDSRPVGTLIGVIAAADEDIDALVAEGGGGGSGGGDATAAADGADQRGDAADDGDAGEGGEADERGDADGQGAADDAAAEGAPESPGKKETAGRKEGQKQDAPDKGAPGSDAAKKQAPRKDAPPDAGATAAQKPGVKAGDGRVKSSPLARRLAAERGVDIGSVEGSGPGGRVVKRDVEQAGEARPAAAAAPAAAGRPDGAGADYEDVPLTQIRKTIARRLSESIGPIPTFYLTVEIDMTRVTEAREAMIDMGDEFKASFNDIIMKAVATALRQHPEVNAHWLNDRIRYFNRVHLGMAVATDDGLIVPVIFDADTKSLREISAESRELAKRARERKLKPEEYTGSTFSVSNLGMFGIDQFTAIINPPETGILAIGAIEKKPVETDEGLEMRPRLRMTMSCDHRAVDGAVGSKFLVTLRRLLENPLMLVF
jgi:pyruvate dehydrogenase E2 component (dihydrolipoamide acetyltransferase)